MADAKKFSVWLVDCANSLEPNVQSQIREMLDKWIGQVTRKASAGDAVWTREIAWQQDQIKASETPPKLVLYFVPKRSEDIIKFAQFHSHMLKGVPPGEAAGWTDVKSHKDKNGDIVADLAASEVFLDSVTIVKGATDQKLIADTKAQTFAHSAIHEAMHNQLVMQSDDLHKLLSNGESSAEDPSDADLDLLAKSIDKVVPQWLDGRKIYKTKYGKK